MGCMGTELEYGIRDLRNFTRQVIDDVEKGNTVYLTNHGRRIAVIKPYVSDDVAQLLAMVDAFPRSDSGAFDELMAHKHADRDLEEVTERERWR